MKLSIVTGIFHFLGIRAVHEETLAMHFTLLKASFVDSAIWVLFQAPSCDLTISKVTSISCSISQYETRSLSNRRFLNSIIPESLILEERILLVRICALPMPQLCDRVDIPDISILEPCAVRGSILDLFKLLECKGLKVLLQLVLNCFRH
jgi:hypothetical protein